MILNKLPDRRESVSIAIY